MKWHAARQMAHAYAATGAWAWVVPCPTAAGGYTVRKGAGPLYRPQDVRVLVEVPPPAKLAPRPMYKPRAQPKAPAWVQGLL